MGQDAHHPRGNGKAVQVIVACVCFGVGEALGALVLCVCTALGIRKIGAK